MSATPSDAAARRAAAFARELQLAERAAAAGEMNHAWRSLELAHIIGQSVLRLHWRAHVRMLVLAWRQRDRREVAAQLARLMLVPLGHLAGRLPHANPGTGRVGAFTVAAWPAELEPASFARRDLPVGRSTTLDRRG